MELRNYNPIVIPIVMVLPLYLIIPLYLAIVPFSTHLVPTTMVLPVITIPIWGWVKTLVPSEPQNSW